MSILKVLIGSNSLKMTAEVDDNEKFYDDAKKYWEDIPLTLDGMLGGLSQVSSIDLGASKKFISHFISGPKAQVKKHRALDCGAGIGRITKRLLLPLFDFVDLVEQNPAFVEEAKTYVGDDASRVEQFICCGLQDFTPEPGRYDVIWCQWVLGHLTNEDLVQFFIRCKAGLAENGVIVLKDNVTHEDVDFDSNDSCFVRPRQMMMDLVNQAGLRIIKEEKQKHFPKDLYDVWTFAVQ